LPYCSPIEVLQCTQAAIWFCASQGLPVLSMLRQVCCLVLLQLGCQLGQLLLTVLHLSLQLTNGSLSNGA
jgi:hypothetical protein